MRAKHRVYTDRDLIVLSPSGELDAAASRAAVRALTRHAEYAPGSNILIDQREARCELSALDVYELAVFLGGPDPALPADRRVAILTGSLRSFDQAGFLALCARNRGLTIRPFLDAQEAAGWLDAASPPGAPQ